MWIWIIIIFVVVGAIWGLLSGDGRGEDAASGALAGGCMAIGCLGRIALIGLSILLVLWLCSVLF